MNAPGLAIGSGWVDLATGPAAESLIAESLPGFVARQRWFGAKDQVIRRMRVVRSAQFPADPGRAGADGWRVVMVQIDLGDGRREEYFLPLGLTWQPADATGGPGPLPPAIAPVRRLEQTGVVHDATAEPAFVGAALRAMAAGADLPGTEGDMLEFRSTPALAAIPFGDPPQARAASGEQSNTCVFVEPRLIFKAYRRLHPGIHPEIEMMAFLTARAPQVAIPALLGTIQWRSSSGEPTAVGLLMAQVINQGDAWAYTRAHLIRSFEQSHSSDPGVGPVWHRAYLKIAALIGHRTAELHRALCPGDEPAPAFRPEPITARDLATSADGFSAQLAATFAQLREWLSLRAAEDSGPPGSPAISSPANAPSALNDGTVELIQRLLALEPVARERAHRLRNQRFSAAKTRFHGDLHLGQVLIEADDVVIIDFEGEPRRALADRREKNSPLKDVAGVIRSFDYAAAAAVAAVRSAPELPPGQLPEFQRFCAEWAPRAVAAFLDGYRATIAGCPVWPQPDPAARELLEFYILEKALYEVGYELANRPAWVAIPVRALVDLLT